MYEIMSDVQMDGSIAHQPLTALEQWKASRHRSLWVAVRICTVFKWTAPENYINKKHNG